MDGQRIGGSKHLKPSFWSGLLHYQLPTCRDCPQWGEAIIYPRACWHLSYTDGFRCRWPLVLQIWRLKLKRILKRVKA